MKFYVQGKIFSVRKRVSDEKEVVYAQFLQKNENGASITDVKIVEDPQGLIKEEQSVRIPIKISTYNNKVFYTQNGQIEAVK
ncbi:hypothetical protein [Nitratiruptor sp. YY09-18]|uniref:hypothetical protein n=1 Tax=Nitratiruptor sp. YY09-18 TaxID=2724901 RepID=UPI001915622E|nr:hypothetical protein [Nitratiruptor sp. YY09-18]BCD67607.1 hypothetical protein NitYY0918_C0506 [Nitratiruptor sp. YY09-18]